MPAPAVMTMTSAFLMIYFTHEVASCAIQICQYPCHLL